MSNSSIFRLATSIDQILSKRVGILRVRSKATCISRNATFVLNELRHLQLPGVQRLYIVGGSMTLIATEAGYTMILSAASNCDCERYYQPLKYSPSMLFLH